MKFRIVLIMMAGLAVGFLLFAGVMLVLQSGESGSSDWLREHLARGRSDEQVVQSPARTGPRETIPTGSGPASQPIQTDVDPLEELEYQVADLREENAELSTLNEKLRGQLVQIFNWILTNFKGRYPLPEEHLPKLRLTAVTEELEVHPDVAQFLNMSDQEKVMLNDAFAYASAVLETIEQESLTLTRPNEEKVIVHIPPFPDQGEELREELYAAIATTLGENRFGRFLDVSEEGLESTFNLFGAASRTIIFETLYSPDDEMPQLRIKDGWVVQEADNKRVITATETTLTELPDFYAKYLNGLPDANGISLETGSFQ
jgi:hypothetical protein